MRVASLGPLADLRLSLTDSGAASGFECWLKVDTFLFSYQPHHDTAFFRVEVNVVFCENDLLDRG